MPRRCKECGLEWPGVGSCPDCGWAPVVGPLEAVYDAEIAPLMAQVIEIAKGYGIGFFATACLEGDLRCTTSIPPPDGADPSHAAVVHGCVRVARHGHSVVTPMELLLVATGGIPELERLAGRRRR